MGKNIFTVKWRMQIPLGKDSSILRLQPSSVYIGRHKKHRRSLLFSNFCGTVFSRVLPESGVPESDIVIYIAGNIFEPKLFIKIIRNSTTQLTLYAELEEKKWESVSRTMTLH